MFWKKKKDKNLEYTYEVEAKYTGTTMKMRKGIFFINCELVVDGQKYTFISEELYTDPQEYIKDNLINKFKIKIAEEDSKPIYSKYEMVIDDVLDWIDSQNEEEDY